MSERLLPPESGPATKAIAYTFDTLGRFGPLLYTIKRYGIDIVPDDWVPWLIYEYGLEDVVPYIRDLRRVLAEGPTWQARRGTPSGIEIGLGWVESAGVVDAPDGRHNWWEFQIGFNLPASDLDQIRQMDGIVRLSKASEDELFRMFSPAADFRPVRMDRHRTDTGGRFDSYSGVRLWEGGPLVAFGWSSTAEVETGSDATGGTEITTSITLVWFGDGMRFDRHRADGSRPMRIASAGIEIDRTSEILDRRDVWPNAWPLGSWAAGAEPQPVPTPLEISE